MKQPLDLTVMMYHYVRDPGDVAEAGSGIPGMPVKTFIAQLDELSKHHTFVKWLDVQAAIREARPLPASACLLTFDDGVCDHYLNVFNILHDRGISGLFFVLARRERDGLTLAHKIHFLLAKLGLVELRNSIWNELNSAQRERFKQAEERYERNYQFNSIERQIDILKAVLQRDLSTDANLLLRDLFERYIGSEQETTRSYYLNIDQIREMSSGDMHFGGHSQTHPWFDWIDAEQREVEIKASAELLSQIEPGPWAFAYPYGGLSNDSPGILKGHSFIAAFTTRTRLRHHNPYFIGRLDGEEVNYDGQSHA